MVDDHHGIGVDLQNEVDYFFHVGCVEEVFLRIVVGGCSDNDEVGVAVCLASVKGGGEVEGFLRKVLLNIVILDG